MSPEGSQIQIPDDVILVAILRPDHGRGRQVPFGELEEEKNRKKNDGSETISPFRVVGKCVMLIRLSDVSAESLPLPLGEGWGEGKGQAISTFMPILS